jgi:hypothetical protein
MNVGDGDDDDDDVDGNWVNNFIMIRKCIE